VDVLEGVAKVGSQAFWVIYGSILCNVNWFP
jgi:hypothetical protein